MPCKHSVKLGRRGGVPFAAGFYIYVGSARRGFSARLRHYLRQITKPHWHIDHLLAVATLKGVILASTEEALECRLAALLGESLDVVPHFGSSDCRCPGHLFLAADEETAHANVSDALYLLGVKPLRLEAVTFRDFIGL